MYYSEDEDELEVEPVRERKESLVQESLKEESLEILL